MPGRKHIPVAMTVAGSDSGGGAGIQADLKTFAAFRVFGTSAITCLTAQNPDGVAGIEPVGPGFVALQIKTICSAFKVASAKTGMLYSSEIIAAVAESLKRLTIPALVVDPVMISTSGAALLKADAVGILTGRLIPLATVVTPNLDEAAALWGRPIRSVNDAQIAARDLSRQFRTAFVVKGGHLPGLEVEDVLCERGRLTVFSSRRVRARETHGTGCTFSAALSASMALGHSLRESVREAKQWVTASLRQALNTGKHRPLGFAG